MIANIAWAFWVLPALGEAGSLDETAKWFGVQLLTPVFLSLLLLGGRKSAYWLIALYGVIIGLYAIGMLGWALMGAGTPYPVYVVSILFFIVSFGVFFTALADLNIGKKERRYDEIENQ